MGAWVGKCCQVRMAGERAFMSSIIVIEVSEPFSLFLNGKNKKATKPSKAVQK